MRFLLIPIGNGSEHMKQVTLYSEDGAPNSITLGRNAMSGLDDVDGNVVKQVQYVSRSHVEVTVDSERVTINPIAKQERIVHLNGSPCERGVRPIQIGDVVSFVGKFNYFNYELREDVVRPPNPAKRQRTIAPNDDNNVIEILDGPTAAITGSRTMTSDVISLVESPPVEALAAPTVTVITNLLRQYECPICYESIACAESLNPCGCVYCFSCIMDWSKKNTTCPTCNTQFDLKTSVPSKLVDNAVRDILKTEAETLAAWEERVQNGLKERTAFREEKKPTTTVQQAPASVPSSSSAVNQPQFPRPAVVAPAAAPAPVRQAPPAAHSGQGFFGFPGTVPCTNPTVPVITHGLLPPYATPAVPQQAGGMLATVRFPNPTVRTEVIDLNNGQRKPSSHSGRPANDEGGVVDLT